jgi:hypothetical protein
MRHLDARYHRLREQVFIDGVLRLVSKQATSYCKSADMALWRSDETPYWP